MNTPKYQIFANLTESLVLEDIRNAGGYFKAAKQMANFPENMGLETSVSLMIVMDMENPLFLLKVMQDSFCKSTKKYWLQIISF